MKQGLTFSDSQAVRRFQRMVAVWGWLVLALLALSCSLPTAAQTGATANANANASVSGANTKPDYTLGAGDAIRIQVFQNPDLTIETRVSENGSITYPLVGAIALGGLSIESAEKKISAALQQGGFLQRPQVNIVLLQIRGNQVAVLGQVNRPGRFPLETANTSGASPTGDDVAVVVGTRQGKLFRQQIDIPSIFLAEKLQDNIVLQGGDSIYVHRAPVFYVYGQVQRPGAYRVERGMTVMQALALGGGPTARGSERRLRLHRTLEGGTLNQITPKLTDPVLVNDVLYVDESIF
jgi:polysaccharide biosynthesis/export protein